MFPLDLSPAAKLFFLLVFLLYLVSELCINTGLKMLLCSAFGRRMEEMMCSGEHRDANQQWERQGAAEESRGRFSKSI